MRVNRYLMLAIALILLGATAMAQDEAPKAELFGGLSYLRTSGNTNVLGWTGQAAFNVSRWLGFAADFAGNYQTKAEQGSRPRADMYTFMFGPRIADRAGRITGFAHALFGGAHMQKGFRMGEAGIPGNATNFAMAFGGGVDANVSDVIAVRVFQADYLNVRSENSLGNKSSRNNFRFSIGVVFKVK